MTRFEYVEVAITGIEYCDERDLAVEDPKNRKVVALWYDEAIVLDGTHDELVAFADRLRAVLDGDAGAGL